MRSKMPAPQRARLKPGEVRLIQIRVTKPLFAWDCLEDSPTLKTLKQLLEVIPDETLLASLQAARGKGRNDYSLRSLWGILVLSIALRHPNIESCLAELRRKESLRRRLDIPSEEHVPRKWNLSRFLDALGREPHLSRLRGIFDSMIGRPRAFVAAAGGPLPACGRARRGSPAPGPGACRPA